MKFLKEFKRQDRLYHLMVGYLLFSFSFIGFYFLIMNLGYSYFLSLLTVIIAAIGKEVKDEYVYGGFDMFDLTATIIGGVFSLVITILSLLGH